MAHKKYIYFSNFFVNTIYKEKEKFMNFQEYLDGKDKPIVSLTGDTGPEPKKSEKPPKAATKGKNWRVEAAQVKDNIDPKPYSAPGTDPGLQNADGKAGFANPLGQKGDEKLIYKPKTEDQTLKTALKTKTESFIDYTKNLTANQYANHVLGNTNPKIISQIIETSEIVSKDEYLIETLVREIKRKGNFEKLVEAILHQPETYTELAINLADSTRGKEIARQIARAINEITAPPADIKTNKKKKEEGKGRPAKNGPNDQEFNQNDDVNINTGGKMLKAEHHLIEALMNYNSIKFTIQEMLSKHQ